MQFISTYRSKTTRLDASKELRNMVIFSNNVVLPILNEILETSAEKSFKHDKISKYTEPKNALKKKSIAFSSLNKAEKETKSRTATVIKKEIELSNDIEIKDRLNIYKNYLHYCVTGNVVELGLGSAIVLEHDIKEFTYLKHLGDILGLSQLELAEIHQSMAELAFRTQVQLIIDKGDLTPKKMEQIKNLEKKLGISNSNADKIIRATQTKKIQKSYEQDNLNLDRLLELSQQGVELESIATEKMRMQILRLDIEKAMSDGTGSYDTNRFNVIYPRALKLNTSKVISLIEEIASSKKRSTFVQAISFYRQKKGPELVKAVQNMVSQYRASPSPICWDKEDETKGLYAMYLEQANSPILADDAAKALGLSIEDSIKIKNIVNSTLKERTYVKKRMDNFDYFY